MRNCCDWSVVWERNSASIAWQIFYECVKMESEKNQKPNQREQ